MSRVDYRPIPIEQQDFYGSNHSLLKPQKIESAKMIYDNAWFDRKAMDDKRELLRHFLAALAYRTQKALRDAPDGFGDFRAPEGTRTPSELVRHMTSVLGYARTFFTGGKYWPDALSSLPEEVVRFHEVLEDLGRHIESGNPFREGVTEERLLQGPLSDAMTHAGQLAMLRRLAGVPVAPENFVFADITSARLGAEQAEPAQPDETWAEAPEGWLPPSQRKNG